jgi:hypothetical protein
MDNEKTPKNANKFSCEKCDYNCYNKFDFNRHLATRKHTMDNIDNAKTQNVASAYCCTNCGNSYKHQSGLCKHKKTCNHENITIIEDGKIDTSTLDMNLIMQLLKQNDEFKALMVEQNTMLVEAYKNTTTNITNTGNINSNNKTFNLQVFLNEQCKDAMNIMEFVDTIKLDLSDAESVRKLGYVNGISNIIIKHLKALDIHMRPVHCTDLKRETVYVKYQDVWEKEGDDNKLMRKAIKHVAVKNYNAADIFKELHPDCMNWDSKHGDHFSLLRIEALGGKGNINIYDSHTKIIKKIAKEVTIDKTNS